MVEIADLGETLATLGHLLAYAALGACFAMSLRPPGTTTQPDVEVVRLGRAALIVAILSGYGALLELLQRTVSARSFQWSDLLANAVGALLGVAAVLVFRRR